MDGHHAHGVVCGFQIAFDVEIEFVERGEKRRKRRGCTSLVGESERQKFIQRIIGFRA